MFKISQSSNQVTKKVFLIKKPLNLRVSVEKNGPFEIVHSANFKKMFFGGMNNKTFYGLN
jgi:hypothetical protein